MSDAQDHETEGTRPATDEAGAGERQSKGKGSAQERTTLNDPLTNTDLEAPRAPFGK